MEQHPIPQQISSYEFKLVGEMTLKQFLKAAAGIVLALMIKSTSLVFFLKWPLMILCGGGGLMLAFVPFQDRPIEAWIIAFLKSIYSPTIYTYKKKAGKDWMGIKPVKAEEEGEEEEKVELKPAKQANEYIRSLPTDKRKSVELKEVSDEERKIEVNQEEEAKKQELKEIAIPEEMLVKEEPEKIKKETGDIKTATVQKNWRKEKTDLNLAKAKLGATGQAVFGEIPMPDVPEVPNVIVGMIRDKQGKIVEGVIVEIQDEKGNPVRVLKTNALGQFRSTTALPNGRYLLIIEKEGMEFDRVNVDLVDKIVEPIKIDEK
jgi:hypothetical protein